jgi:2-methylisocitrate lyase-like PEP mutase family enzyme
VSLAGAEGAGRLRALQEEPGLLVLPNCWDAATARRFEKAGFPVAATSSVAMAEALGYEDHQHTPPQEMLGAVARIARAIDVPLTADLEAGYGLDAAELAEGLIAAGGIGLNLEDTDHDGGGESLVPAEAHAERLAAVKTAGRAAGVDLVLNARIDVYLRGGDEADGLDRAHRYVEAGADSVYPIGLGDEDGIARWVEQVDAVVNILIRPGAPTPARLAELGVRRASVGGGPYHYAMGHVDALAQRLKPEADQPVYDRF